MDGTYKYIIAIIIVLFWGNGLYAQQVNNSSAANENNKIFRNLGPKINSRLDEFLPVVYKDTLYFRRNLSKKNVQLYRTEINQYLCNDPVLSSFSPEPIPIKKYRESSEPIDKPIKMDPSTPSFYNYSDSISDWESPRPMQFGISSDYNDLHPAIAPDGSFLVFASDRAAEAGGERQNHTDLYISYRRKDGSWSAPKTLGKKYNTSQNEITPYIAKDFTLYFSSKGFRSGSGEIFFSGQGENLSDIQLMESKYNYDIMMVKPDIQSGKVKYTQAPLKLGYPLNTEWDEIGPAMYNDSLILSSNRPSNSLWGIALGGFDLYAWCFEKCPCDSQCKPVVIWGKISGSAFNILPEADIKIFAENENGERVLVEDSIIGKEGKYRFVIDRYCTYHLEVNHICGGILTDSLCTLNPCSVDTMQLLRADFEISGECPGRLPDNCPDCPPRCKEYAYDVYIACDEDTLKIPGELIISQNNFEKHRLSITKPGLNSFKFNQEDLRSDDINISYKSACISGNGIIEKMYFHTCNADSIDRYKVIIELPDKCCGNSCNFNINGKVICADGSKVKSGILNVLSLKDGGMYSGVLNTKGEFSINVNQLNPIGSFKLYIGEGKCKKEVFVNHKCSDGDIKNLIIKLDANCCKECNSKIIFQGYVEPVGYACSLEGDISVIDLDNKLRYRSKVSDDGNFTVEAYYAKNFRVIYENKCSGEKQRKSFTFDKCPDSDIKLNILFQVIDLPQNINVSNYKIPFFVTGYWKPNTQSNLYELFQRFNQRGFGSGETCCITDPASDFDENFEKINYYQYADSAAKIIKELKDYIVSSLKAIECGCNELPESINIYFKGYSDPRPINCDCKYPDEEISEYGINISKGEQITNQTLAELRAYHTSKEVLRLLESNPIFQKYSDLVQIHIVGEEDLESNQPNIIKRSVEVFFEQPELIISTSSRKKTLKEMMLEAGGVTNLK